MTRLLLLSLVVYLVWQGLERLADKKEPRNGSSGLAPEPAPPPAAESVPLVECSRCGIHFAPASSSIEEPFVCSACLKMRRLA